MIIEKIHLENWKTFRDPVEVKFSNGLNVIYGTNETGKTTLVDSIRTVFLNKHNGRSAKIKSIVPWGSKLSPYAEIQFQHENDNYRITKSFISPDSTLEKLEDSIWVRIAEGDMADKEIIQMIGGSLKGSDSKSQYWGLGQSLWMVQGQPEIPENLNEETLDSLQKLIGTSIESESEKTIINEINKRFLNVFTAKKKLKKNSDLNTLKDKIQGYEDTIKEAEQFKLNKESLMRGIEDKKIFLKKEAEKLEIATKEKITLEETVREANEHKKERESLALELNGIETEYNSLKDKIDNFTEGKQKIEGYEQENDDLKNDLDDLNKRLEDKQGEINSVSDTFREKEKLSNDYIEKKTITSITHTTIMEELELDGKESRFKEVNGLFESLKQKIEEFNNLQAPTKKELKKLEKIYKEIHDTKTRLDTLGLEISITPKSAIYGDIYLDGEKDTFKLANGSNRWNAHQSVLLQMNNIGDIEIRSGSEDVKVMKDYLDKLRKEYDESISIYGINDIEDLRNLVNEKYSLDTDIKRLKKEYESKENKDDLLNEINTLKNKIKFNWEKIPEDSPFRDCSNLDKSVAREKLSEMLVEMDEIQEKIRIDKEILNGKLKTLEGEKEKIKEDIQALETEIYGNQQGILEIESILEKYEDFNLEEEETKLDGLAVDIDRKARVLKVFENEIKEKEEAPTKAYEEADNKVNNLNEIVSGLKLDLASLEGHLNQMISQFEDTNKIEEKLEVLRKTEEELEIETNAIELLYNLTQFYRENTVVELSQPIQDQMTQYLEHLLGKYSGINLSKDIKPTSLDITGSDEEVPLDDLSFGTQEQIWCLFRLALGKFLSKEDRQLVVLDDPLVNTDYARLQRIIEILDECAKDLQIIILTCDVDKYNGLKANFIPLETKYGVKIGEVDLDMVP